MLEANDHEKRAQIRSEIIAAAAAVFERRGYQAATMQGIAKQAGYGTASLYTYFTSKEEIFEAMIEELTAKYHEVFRDSPPPELPFLKKVEHLVQGLMQLTHQYRDAIGVYMSLRPEADILPGKRGQRPRVAGYLEVMGAMVSWFERTAPRKVLARSSADDQAKVLAGILRSFTLSMIAEPTGEWSKTPAKVAAFFLYGIAGAPG